MKKIYLLTASVLLSGVLATAQSFTNGTTLLGNDHNSGGCTGVVDMNDDGLDDIVILDQSTDLYVAYQQPDGTFDISSFGTVSAEGQWGMSVGDVDNDGHKDVMCGGYYDDIHIININGPGDYAQEDYGGWASIFFQGSCFGDINNDGWLDAFACHDDGQSAILANDGDGTFSNGAAWMDLDFDDTDDSGNYGSTFTDVDRDGDLDLFIAKCRQFVNDPYDGRRTNRLLINDGNNNFTEEAAIRGLVNLQQSWTSDFADLDNDGDFECFLTTHSGTLEIYDNDGNGYFTNVTAGSGLEVTGFFLQAKWADFDNDGWVDLVHSGGSHRFFHNNGDMTFTQVNNVFQNSDTMHSFGIGDLNHDGWLDLYASYGDGYIDPDMGNDDKLFMNQAGENNFIVFDLTGTISNKGAVGAIVEIHGPFGVQVREIRAGESYGITNTSMCHFGIGTSTEVDYALVYWPSGIVQIVDSPVINSWTEVTEEECVAPEATISAMGSTNICPGESVMLMVDNAGGDYQWSNGETGSSITVTQGGTYKLIVWNSEGCAGTSNEIVITVIQNQPATVQISGDLSFCQGSSVQLIASAGNTYEWSNGAQTQAVTITEGGTYTVDITNECAGSVSTSEAVVVEVYSAPATPVVSDVTLNTPGTATLTTTGADVRWYDAQLSSTPVGTGTSFTTPVLNATTSYWVEDVTTHGGEQGTGGKLVNSTDSEGQYHNSSNYYLTFDANTDINIKQVKVFAGNAGSRNIQVVQNGNVIAEGDFTIPQGESFVELNFFVAEGTGYGLRCTNNNPQLWRDKDLSENTPFNFPYDLDGLATITGTTVAGNDSDNYYYFFYDWTVETPMWECPSDRDEVVVTITGIDELVGITSMNVYPNPSKDVVTIDYTSVISTNMQVRLLDATGRVVLTSNQSTHSGSNKFQMDLTAVAAGIYNLEFTANGSSSSTKLIVE
jgi:Secretion system C-terminal sorting domain/ASPIC and UnbV/Ig-like domain CHU_C associated/FG-GAP-like repeat